MAQIVKECFKDHETSYPHMDGPSHSQGLNPIENLRNVLEKLWCPESIIINSRFWWKVNATVDVNKSYDIAEGIDTMPFVGDFLFARQCTIQLNYVESVYT